MNIESTQLAVVDATRGVLLYDSNNSGGRWWLADETWNRLADAGWNVHWGGRNYSDPLGPGAGERGQRYLGALAFSCAKRFAHPNDGINEWTRITGANPSDEGCNCCGPPHSFDWTGDDGTTASASAVVVETALQWHGL